MKTVRKTLSKVIGRTSKIDSELLLAHTIKQDRAFILAHPEHAISKKIVNQFQKFLERRKRGEPIALIIGKKEFFGREFLVNNSTLVPRPETETLVEKILEYISLPREKEISKEKNISKKEILILDVGTGSGNIMTTIIKELEQKNFYEKFFSFISIDISRKALNLARRNAKKHGAERYIQFIRSDLLKKIPKKLFQNAREIICVANLPYLSKENYANSPREVQNFEPRIALESGTDGLDHYRALLSELRNRKNSGHIQGNVSAFFEIDPEQKRSFTQIVKKILPETIIRYSKDLSGKNRVVALSEKRSDRK